MKTRHQYEHRHHIRQAGFLIALSAIALVALALQNTQPAHAANDQHARTTAHFQINEPSLPSVGQFIDHTDGTSLSIQFQAAGNTPAGTFIFTIPSGTQVSGVLPLVQQSDGSLAQETFPDGGLVVHVIVTFSDADAQKVGLSSAPTVSKVSGQFEPHGLGAYFALSLEIFNGQVYQLIDGCQGALNSCTSISDAALSQVVNNYDGNVVNQNWPAVYNNSAQSIQAQYTANQLTSLLTAEVKESGAVTQITTDDASFALHADSAGQVYFSVGQISTLIHNGKTSTRHVTSYYLLDSGTWLFWFSQ